MKRWHRRVTSCTRAEIREAIADEGWQRFRRSLKGLSTEDKLQQLEGYISRREMSRGKMTRIEQVRIDNYINALLRGGQLVHKNDGAIHVQR